MKLLEDKSIQEIASQLYEMAQDMDCMDYEFEKDQELAEIENFLYYLKACAQNEYNQKYFRVFWKVLQRIS